MSWLGTGKIADYVAEQTDKGQLLSINGWLRGRSYGDIGGVLRTNVEVVVEQFDRGLR